MARSLRDRNGAAAPKWVAALFAFYSTWEALVRPLARECSEGF